MLKTGRLSNKLFAARWDGGTCKVLYRRLTSSSSDVDNTRMKLRELMRGNKMLRDLKDAGDTGHLADQNTEHLVLKSQFSVNMIENNTTVTIPVATKPWKSTLMLLSYNQLGYDRLKSWRTTIMGDADDTRWWGSAYAVQRVEICVVESMMRFLGKSFLSRALINSGADPKHTALWLGSFTQQAQELDATNMATGYVFVIDGGTGLVRFRATGMMDVDGEKELRDVICRKQR